MRILREMADALSEEEKVQTAAIYAATVASLAVLLIRHRFGWDSSIWVLLPWDYWNMRLINSIQVRRKERK
jgi:hypothetical protein